MLNNKRHVDCEYTAAVKRSDTKQEAVIALFPECYFFQRDLFNWILKRGDDSVGTPAARTSLPVLPVVPAQSHSAAAPVSQSIRGALTAGAEGRSRSAAVFLFSVDPWAVPWGGSQTDCSWSLPASCPYFLQGYFFPFLSMPETTYCWHVTG